MSSRLVAGSPAAMAWAAKMQKKKSAIRAAGLRTEKQFFGPGGEFDDEAAAKVRTNPTGGPFDKDAARELELYGTNNADLYRQMETPIRLNLEKKYKKGIYQSALAVRLWSGWADEAAKRYNKEFGGGGSKWFEMFSPATRLHVAKEQEAFHKGEMELGNFQVTAKKNPKPRLIYHAYVANKNLKVLHRFFNNRNEFSVQITGGKWNVGTLFSPRLRESLSYARREIQKKHPRAPWRVVLNETAPFIGPDANPKQKKNPITLNGNPPKRISATVAGVLYNRVVEIQAEKTGGKHKGFWYHPFKGQSDVQMLALDNGDLLIHSKAGKSLWRPD